MSEREEENKTKGEGESGNSEVVGAREQISQLEARLKRALADYDNLKKQTQREKEELSKYANQALIENLVSIWEGLRLVTRQFHQLLSLNGYQEIEVEVGDEFDPHIMEAVVSEGEGEEVVEVLGGGYKLHGKVIRPVKVKVGETLKE